MLKKVERVNCIIEINLNMLTIILFIYFLNSFLVKLKTFFYLKLQLDQFLIMILFLAKLLSKYFLSKELIDSARC